jgi:hypothetical protein
MKSTFPDGAALREMRLNAGLTIDQLADAVGYYSVFLMLAEEKQGLLKGSMPRKIRRYLESLRAHERLSKVNISGRTEARTIPIDWAYPCGARTRKDTPCRQKAVYASGRCKLHGGLSTGPITEEGKERIREGQRRRRERERLGIK